MLGNKRGLGGFTAADVRRGEVRSVFLVRCVSVLREMGESEGDGGELDGLWTKGLGWVVQTRWTDRLGDGFVGGVSRPKPL